MGNGDLNLLKSWNPKLVKNRAKVWQKEQEKLNEEALIKKKLAEINKEKELASLVGETKKDNRMDWMYKSDANIASELKKDYLLGKKKLDKNVIKTQKNPSRKK
ncbi:hypothetical protein TBLA_0A05780 [Henningerozyma blattae CBS 6284]|uniref:Pre-mRNA-splicing factor CWC25 n=1 Tax=Henningerozyma blattae (strain ATCC 34711 / CBS 6284 / DSM 70876 / NBRC 10599 / NRRL Y-10934 / UCD 77-7) TaxID=1071380 RepID=I2GW69_HENB6|nr:hypothetical protein TBLA_0A05780 [Tetrapisispora blattae CBS 6284]CCH58371.1 hypothetical protein TBLA_0A05780 [Tetrapisispora blattae CBS 6284]